jgi:mannitol-specific phosphotransferase system IIBC component
MTKKTNITLVAGMEFESPWMGKAKVITVNGDDCDIFWYRMGIIQSHITELIIDEIALEQKNKKREENLKKQDERYKKKLEKLNKGNIENDKGRS